MSQLPKLVAQTHIFICMPCPSAETGWCGNTCSQVCCVSLPPHGGLACLLGCLPCSHSTACPSGHACVPAPSQGGMGRTIYILSLPQSQQIAAYLITSHVLVLPDHLAACASLFYRKGMSVPTCQPGHTCSYACHGPGLLMDGLGTSV